MRTQTERTRSARHPLPAWLRMVTALLWLLAFFKIVGSFLFEFSLGTSQGYVVGAMLLSFGVFEAILGIKLCRGDLWTYNTARGLLTVDFVWNAYHVYDDFRLGDPSINIALFAAVVVALTLLHLPSVRRFYAVESD